MIPNTGRSPGILHHEIVRILKGLKGDSDIISYLDIGCGDGSLTLEIAELIGAREVFGIDLSDTNIHNASRKGLRCYKVDVDEQSLPFNNGTFDLVTAFEVIEHITNTDNLMSEAFRVLKSKGKFVLSTPNLVSWLNRLLMLFGYLPFEYEVSLLHHVERRPLQRTLPTYGHIRLYSLKALTRHLEIYGFKVANVTGASLPYATRLSITKLLDRILKKKTSLACGLIVEAMKP